MMTQKQDSSFLPIIIGSFGGLNPAGRTGNHRGYGFIIRDCLESQKRSELVLHQARLMNFIHWSNEGWRDQEGKILAPGDIAATFDPILNKHCFIRLPKKDLYFDPYNVPMNRKIVLEQGEILWPKKNLPSPLPDTWEVVGEDPEKKMVRLHIGTATEIFIPDKERLEVSSAGMIPDGVNLTCSGFGTKADKIPHGIKLALFGANDALKNLGIPLDEIYQMIPQNQIGLYIGSAMGQVDPQGLGYIQAPLLDQRPPSTSVPFSLNNMAADFIAAYVMGSIGHISCEVGACATLLFNLYNATRDIRNGKIQFAMVGAADAPIQPWIFSAYHSMKAVARDESIISANGELFRERASVPFGNNFGFTLAEGSQFLTLFHPELAKKLGVPIQGAIGDVFCHSDGWKKSISKPGIGNYLTIGRALSAVEKHLGSEALKNRSFVSAHGSSTPQNRKTESSILNEFAKAFGINNWPITAMKSWLGHTLGPASGDQITSALGAFHYNFINPIRSLDQIADDVERDHLLICQKPFSIPNDSKDGKMDCCIVNSKGFGGHNATALVYSPEIAQTFLKGSMEKIEWQQYEKKRDNALKNQENAENKFLHGEEMIEYSTSHPYLEEDIESLTREGIKIKGIKPTIKFD